MTATKSSPSSSNAGGVIATLSMESKWITLVEDQDARIFTFSACMALADLRGEGKCSLVIGELSETSGQVRLRALDGQSWRDAFKLTDFPSSVLVINLETSESGKRIVPAIAVSVGNLVYVYKTMKPLCRYQLPHHPPLKEEEELWTAAKQKNITVPDLYARLNELRGTFSETLLTQRTRSFLLVSPDEREYFVQEHDEKPLFRSSIITCMSTLNKKLKDENSEQYLAVGTESKYVYIVDAISNITKAQHELPDVPASLTTHGTFNDKYRIFVSCRDGKIYTITKDFPELVCIAPNDRPITLLNTGKYLVVPCMDGVLYFYKGKNHELQHRCESPITCAEVIKFEATGLRAVAVALLNKELRIFKDDQMVDLFPCDDVVVAMKYGKFDREDGALALVLQIVDPLDWHPPLPSESVFPNEAVSHPYWSIMNKTDGTVIIKLIKRRAKFEPIIRERTLKPLDSLIPKRSTLFLDQTQRERENCKRMNTGIFDNLTRMKYEINKRYADSLQIQSGGTSMTENVLVTPQLLGLGPFFKLVVTVQNMSTESPMIGYNVYLQLDPTMYTLQKSFLEIPFVVPRGKFVFVRAFKFIGQQIMQGDITIHLLKDNGTVPLLSVLAVVPESDVGLV